MIVKREIERERNDIGSARKIRERKERGRES